MAVRKAAMPAKKAAPKRKAQPRRKAPARRPAKKSAPKRVPRARPVPFASRAAQKRRNAASPAGGADPHHADLSPSGIQAELDHQNPSINAQHSGALAEHDGHQNYGEFKNKKVGRMDVVSNWYRKGRGR